jgi:hypothetical protein
MAAYLDPAPRQHSLWEEIGVPEEYPGLWVERFTSEIEPKISEVKSAYR